MESTERSVSVWELNSAQRSFTPLAGSTVADVCVVGAGIAGITTAYLLAREGSRVVVLDKDAVGAGETGQTTAHLASAQDDFFHVLERVHGPEGARLAHESHHAAIDRIGEIAATEGIDCGFRRVDGYWILDPSHSRSLLEEEEAAARRAGAEVELVERVPGTPVDTGPALRFAAQGRMDALRYLAGVTDALVRLGGRVHTGTPVTEVEGGSPATVRGEGFSVAAGAVVVATNPPIHDRFALHARQAPYRTFVVAARIPAGTVPDVLLWDTLDPYHYVRTAPVEGDPDRRWLIVGGEDVKQGHEDDDEARFERLVEWARPRFGMERAELRWSGMVMEPADSLAFIGRDPGGRRNVYLCTGDSGQGMTHGTIAGMLIRDLVLGRPNPWETLYDPGRTSLAAAAVRELATETLDVAAQYLRSAPLGGDVSGTDEIPPGTGAIVQRGVRKIAVHRDETGRLHELSPHCTHLGCMVAWNATEASWDCPCHGSRFAPTGEVLTGPAISPLPRIDEEKDGKEDTRR